MQSSAPHSRNVVCIAAFLLLGARCFADGSVPAASVTQLCDQDGAFGYRFGDQFSGAKIPKDTFFFGRGCYEVAPAVAHPSFDTYAVCVSEFDGKIYQFQASKTFDTKVPSGSKSLSPAQVRSNRSLGKQVLNSLLSELPDAVASQVKFNEQGTEWNLFVKDGVRFEVSNLVGWAVSMECRNESMAQMVYRQRIHGVRQ